MDKVTINNPGEETSIGVNGKVQKSIEVTSLTDVSDGYHSIAELYDHRITLFIALCRFVQDADETATDYGGVPPRKRVWRSKFHSDGNPAYEGWFIMGIGKEKGDQISYHLPLSRWDETDFAETLDKAPIWDGHTSADVLNRLKAL